MIESVENGKKPELTAWHDWTSSDSANSYTAQTDAIFGFRSRWQLAHSFHGLELNGYVKGSAIPLGYQALFKVDIVCTAAEQLARVIEFPREKCFLNVEHVEMADRVRRDLEVYPASRFVENLRKNARGRACENLMAFADRSSSDLMYLMRPLRNGVSHGTSTPTGLGLPSNNKKSLHKIETLLELCQTVLDDCDRQFTEFVTTH